MRKFEIRVEGSVLLDIDDVWPDGDAPDDPTAEHVLALLAQEGDVTAGLINWSLEDDFEFLVHAVDVEEPSK